MNKVEVATPPPAQARLPQMSDPMIQGNTFMQMLVHKHGPAEAHKGINSSGGIQFWVCDKNTPPFQPPHGKLTLCEKVNFQNNYNVCKKMTREGIVTQCVSKPSKPRAKNNPYLLTVKYPQFSVYQHSICCVNDEHSSIYTLCELRWTK